MGRWGAFLARGDFEFDAEELVHFVDDGFGFFLGQRFVEVALFAGRRRREEVGALIIVFAGVEGLGVATGTFARGGDDETTELVEEFGLFLEREVGLGGFEEGVEELQLEESFGG